MGAITVATGFFEMSDVTALTPEGLVALFAEAGDLDAGTEILDALRLRRSDQRALLPLQALLFKARHRDRAHRAKVLAALREGVVDELARDGYLLEAAAAWRALARVWPDELGWSERLERVERLIDPLDPSRSDSTRTSIDDALARGELHGAWELLSAASAAAPHDLAVAQRVDALRVVLFGPSNTRPYQSGDEADRGSLVSASTRASAEALRGSRPPVEPRPSSPSGEVRVAHRRVVRVGKSTP